MIFYMSHVEASKCTACFCLSIRSSAIATALFVDDRRIKYWKKNVKIFAKSREIYNNLEIFIIKLLKVCLR